MHIFFPEVGLFQLICDILLVCGHSFLSSDRDFANIEKKQKVKQVYVPEQWHDVIHSAKMIKPFTVDYD